jgi:WD40 repeat protein
MIKRLFAIILFCLLLPSPTEAQDDTPAVPTLGALHIIPHAEMLIGAQWAADNSAVLTWAADARLRRYDPVTGELLRQTTLAFAPQGLVLTPDTARLAIWNGAQLAVQPSRGAGTLNLFQAPTPVTGAHWQPDGRRLWTWHPDGALIGWDVGPAQQPTIAVRIEHSHPIANATWHPDGRAAILGSWSGVGAIVDFETQVVTPFSQQTGALVGGVWVGEQAVSWGWDGSLWEQPGGRINARVQSTARLWDAQVIGADILTPTAGNALLVWDTATLQPRASLDHDDRVTGFSSAAGLVLTTSQDGTARLWGAASAALTLSYTHGVAVRGGALSHDGTRLWTLAEDNTLRLFIVPGVDDCYVTAPANVNQRETPSTRGAFIETLTAYTSAVVGGATTGGQGFRWWQLENGAWVREDVVLALPACDALSLN